MRVVVFDIESFRARRIQEWIRLMLLCVSMATGSTPAAVRAAAFTATLEPDTVAVGDTAALRLVFEGSGQIQLSPVPGIPGLVISGPEQGSSTRIVNGQRTDSVNVTYYLRPTEARVFSIPSLTAQIAGETFRSPTLQLRAVNATQSGTSEALALLRLVVPRERVYLGESLVIELQLLLNRSVSNISGFDMPNFSGEGWLAGEPMQGQKRQAQYGGQIMTVIPIRIPLTPLRTGTLRLGPVESSVVAQVPAPRRANDPFGGFGLFQRTESRRVALALPAHTIQVLPLPTENVPETFAGALGKFEMAVTAGPTNVTVGDPITLRVQISGTGNLNSVSLREPLVSGDFKTYEPETKLDTTDEFGFTGMKTVEQIVIPENTEVRELPPIEFSYFDPEAGTYRILTHPATPLRVMPAGSRPAPVVATGTSQSAPDAPRQDIVHIKQRLGRVESVSGNSIFGARFYAFNAGPMLAWLGVVAWRKRQEILGRNPRLRRQQAVRQRVAAGLKELDQLSAEGRAEEFFSTVFRLLQEQIGLSLDQPASGITESVVDDGKGHAPVASVDRAAGGIDEMLHALVTAAFEDGAETHQIALHVGRRILDRVAHPGLGGEVKHPGGTCSGEQGGDRLAIGEVELVEAEPAPESLQPGPFQGGVVIGVEVVKPDHRCAPGQQGLGDGSTDEAGHTGDQDRLGHHRVRRAVTVRVRSDPVDPAAHRGRSWKLWLKSMYLG